MADDGIIRTIGGLEAEVTVSEQHNDNITITGHPVERGAPITDHFYKNPAILTVKASWSPAYLDSDDLSDLYDQLLDMQVSGNLLEVQTGKRLYENMLIADIGTVTDAATENVLMVNLQLREIILVDTMTTTMPAAANRADPQASAGVTNTGTKAPVGPLNPNGTVYY